MGFSLRDMFPASHLNGGADYLKHRKEQILLNKKNKLNSNVFLDLNSPSTQAKGDEQLVEKSRAVC